MRKSYVQRYESVEMRCGLTADFVRKVGDPTILINNAGVVQGKSILDLHPDEIRQCVGCATGSLRT